MSSMTRVRTPANSALMSIFYNVCLSDYSPAAYPDYYPEYPAVPSEDQRLAMLYNLLEDREQQQEAGGRDRDQGDGTLAGRARQSAWPLIR